MSGPAVASALLLAVLCAACVSPPAAPDAPPGGLPAPWAGLLLGDCTGFSVAGPLVPAAASSARPPAGWAGKEAPVAPGVLGFECQRVALGAYERGPVRLVAEVHDNFQAPAACNSGGDWLTVLALASLLADDEAIAHELAQAHGMPARVAAIAAQGGQAGPGARVQWAWSEPGRAASSLSFVRDGSANTDGRPLRLFWGAGGAVGRLDLDMADYAAGSFGPAAGDLHGDLFDGPFAGTAKPHGPYTASGAFRQFADAACGGGRL